jgi:hypothetical protein
MSGHTADNKRKINFVYLWGEWEMGVKEIWIQRVPNF